MNHHKSGTYQDDAPRLHAFDSNRFPDTAASIMRGVYFSLYMIPAMFITAYIENISQSNGFRNFNPADSGIKAPARKRKGARTILSKKGVS